VEWVTYWVLKIVLTPLLRLFYRVEVLGAEHVPAEGAVILASNHQSFIDSIFIPFALRRRVTFLAKAEYFSDRKTAWFFRAVGQIPVHRGGGPASQRAMGAGAGILRAGGVLAIYPEGTRSPDGRLYRGHTGVARLALGCDVPVVPVACSGTAAVQPIGSNRPRLFHAVRISFGAPQSWPSLAGSEDPAVLRNVTDEIMAAIAGLSGQEQVDAYARRSAPTL
jgi:1-acyl-sn-glycerol-3-phosphate acyltransferase